MHCDFCKRFFEPGDMKHGAGGKISCDDCFPEHKRLIDRKNIEREAGLKQIASLLRARFLSTLAESEYYEEIDGDKTSIEFIFYGRAYEITLKGGKKIE